MTYDPHPEHDPTNPESSFSYDKNYLLINGMMDEAASLADPVGGNSYLATDFEGTSRIRLRPTAAGVDRIEIGRGAMPRYSMFQAPLEVEEPELGTQAHVGLALWLDPEMDPPILHTKTPTGEVDEEFEYGEAILYLTLTNKGLQVHPISSVEVLAGDEEYDPAMGDPRLLPTLFMSPHDVIWLFNAIQTSHLDETANGLMVPAPEGPVAGLAKHKFQLNESVVNGVDVINSRAEMEWDEEDSMQVLSKEVDFAEDTGDADLEVLHLKYYGVTGTLTRPTEDTEHVVGEIEEEREIEDDAKWTGRDAQYDLRIISDQHLPFVTAEGESVMGREFEFSIYESEVYVLLEQPHPDGTAELVWKPLADESIRWVKNFITEAEGYMFLEDNVPSSAALEAEGDDRFISELRTMLFVAGTEKDSDLVERLTELPEVLALTNIADTAPTHTDKEGRWARLEMPSFYIDIEAGNYDMWVGAIDEAEIGIEQPLIRYVQKDPGARRAWELRIFEDKDPEWSGDHRNVITALGLVRLFGDDFYTMTIGRPLLRFTDE